MRYLYAREGAALLSVAEDSRVQAARELRIGSDCSVERRGRGAARAAGWEHSLVPFSETGEQLCTSERMDYCGKRTV
ncbi:hypothetical protein GN956_G8464 [Arapaima gigas]